MGKFTKKVVKVKSCIIVRNENKIDYSGWDRFWDRVFGRRPPKKTYHLQAKITVDKPLLMMNDIVANLDDSINWKVTSVLNDGGYCLRTTYPWDYPEDYSMLGDTLMVKNFFIEMGWG